MADRTTEALAAARAWMASCEGQKYACVREGYYRQPNKTCIGCVVKGLVRAMEQPAEPSALQLLAQDIYGRYLRGSVEPAELLQQLVNAICDGLPDADEAVTCPTCHGKGATAQNGVQYCNCPALTKAGSES